VCEPPLPSPPPPLRTQVDEPSEYVETLLSKAIDEYCAGFVARSEQQIKVEAGEPAEAEHAIDRRLIELVERMIESSLSRSACQSVMGIAIEARRLDLIERVMRMCDTSPGEGEHEASTGAMLSYTFTLAGALSSRPFRRKVRPQTPTPFPHSPPTTRARSGSRRTPIPPRGRRPVAPGPPVGPRTHLPLAPIAPRARRPSSAAPLARPRRPSAARRT
jgi:hypothetical protein